MMDELERDLAAILRRGSEEVAPADDFPARIRARVERRQRHRRLLIGAVPTVCLLIGALTLVVVVGPVRRTPTSSSASPVAPAPRATSNSPTTVPSSRRQSVVPSPPASAAAAAPPVLGPDQAAGAWTPVDVNDGQVLVPPGAVISSTGCPDPGAPATVFLGTGSQPPGVVFHCPNEPTDVTTVLLELMPSGSSTSGLQSTTVNGIKVFEVIGMGGLAAVDDLVPSLGVEMRANGPLASRILRTLSRSPRAVALAQGRAPRVPRSWRRISFGGLRASVPAQWPVRDLDDWGSACDTAPPWELALPDASQPSVTLDEGRAPPPEPCPALASPAIAFGPDQPIPRLVSGLFIDPGPNGPLSGVTSYGACKSIGGLQVCVAHGQQYQGDDLVLRVRNPGGATVAVVIGLAGNGLTARTILHSLRPG